jgi:hypothetical protein
VPIIVPAARTPIRKLVEQGLISRELFQQFPHGGSLSSLWGSIDAFALKRQQELHDWFGKVFISSPHLLRRRVSTDFLSPIPSVVLGEMLVAA